MLHADRGRILVSRDNMPLQAARQVNLSFGVKKGDSRGTVSMWIAVAELGHSPRVVLIDRYGDGTIWWAMEDEHQNRAVVCLDGRCGSPTQFRLLDGTRHPKHPGGKVLELGSPEEGIVVPLLSQWLDSQRPNDVASEHSVEVLRATLLRLGCPAEKVA